MQGRDKQRLFESEVLGKRAQGLPADSSRWWWFTFQWAIMVVFHKGQNQAGWFSEVCLIFFFGDVFSCVHGCSCFLFSLCKIIISQGLTESGQQFGSSHLYLSQEAGTFSFFQEVEQMLHMHTNAIQIAIRMPYIAIHTCFYFFSKYSGAWMPYTMPYHENAIPYAIRTWTECHTYGILRYGILMVWHCVWHSGVWGVSKPEYMYGIEGSGSTYLDFRFYLMRQTFTELKRTILDRTCPIKTECRQDFFFFNLRYVDVIGMGKLWNSIIHTHIYNIVNH